MSLRGKTLIFTGIVFTCAILVLYATSRTILLDGFVRLEEQSTSRNVERVLDALSNDLTNLNSVADDWAAWDDTYAFIENPNEDYIQSNLVNGTFTGLRLNFMLFIHSSGQLVFGKAFDLENEEEIPVPLSLLEHLSADCPFLRHPNPKSNIAGILLLPEGPMLIASRPIVTSESKGPVRGTLLMGRYFDSTEIERLAEITHFSLALQRFDDVQMPPDFQAAKASLSEETPIFVQPLNAETIAGYALLKDVYGKPALLLRADMPRDIYGQGQATTSYFLLSQLLVGLAFGATTLVLLERQVLSRLLSLSRSIRKIGASGNLSARVPAAGKDELGSLAGGINRMLEALEGAQRELQLNEKWLATTLKSIGDAVIATDAEGHVTFMNSVAESLTGWKQEEAVGKPVGDVFNIINEETGEQAENPVKRVMREGIVVGLANHTALIAKDGTKIPIDDCGAPIKDDEGNIMGAVLIFHDITERRRAEEALREAEAKYRTLVEQLPAITYIVGFGEVNRTVYISPQVESLLGFSQDEWLADPELWIKQIHPEDRERVLAEVRSRDASGESLDIEYRVLTRDGRVLWFRNKATLVRDETGRIRFSHGVMLDITERKQAEEALRESEERYKILFESTLDGMCVIDKTMKILLVNQAAANIFGFDSVEEVFGVNPFDFIPPEERERVLTIVTKDMFENDLRQVNEFRLINKAGEEVWISAVGTLIQYKGELAGLVSFRDITERKKAEEALAHERDLLRALMDNVPDSIYFKDTSGRFTRINMAQAQILGVRDPKEAVGKTDFDFFTEEHARDAYIDEQEIVKSGQPLIDKVEKIRRADGEFRWVSATKVPIKNEEGQVTGIVGISRDITDRVWADQEIHRLNQFLESIIDNANIWLNVLDEKLNVVFWNKAAEEISGYSRGEVIGHDKIWEWLYPDEEYRKEVTAKAAAIIERGETEEDSETRIQCKDGQTRIISWNSRRLLDEKGAPIGSIAIGRDITKQVRLEEQLRQSQKMEAIGRLAGGVAHDFNNLLTTILGYSDFLLYRLGPEDPLRGDIETIRKAGERAASLTRQLLAFSRRQMLQPRVLDLNLVVAEVEKMLRRLIGEDIELVSILEPSLKRVKADLGQIEQVIMNLAVNARDAMPEGGTLAIKTENVTVDEEYCKFVPEARPGEFVRLSIEDTGVGMDKEIRQHLFEPFFTTKEGGTGLGLAVVYGIVKQHEGWINVYTEPGQGSTFKVYLPAFSLEPEGEPEKRVSLEEFRGRGEKILVVEDDEGVREFATRVLRENGYVVFEAATAEEALDVFEGEKEDFHLVFSDVILPDKPGLQLIDELLTRKPELRVLLSSGYADRKSQWRIIRERGFRFLQKPYASADLLRVIREIIEPS